MSNQNADGTHGTGPHSANVSDMASGNGAGNPEMDITKLVNDAVSKALGARMKRLNLEEMIQKAVESQINQSVAPSAPVAPVAGETDTPERLSIKTLEARMRAEMSTMKEQLEAERKARAAAESAKAESQLQHDLRTHFAKHMGADNPHLDAYMNMYAKQFQYRDGRTYRVVKDAFDEELALPVDQAAEELFKSELKHLVPSRSASLPPTSIARGMPMMPGGSRAGGLNFLEKEIMFSQASRDADSWAAFQAAAHDPKLPK